MLAKIGILDLSLIKLSQNEQGCNFFASQCRISRTTLNLTVAQLSNKQLSRVFIAVSIYYHEDTDVCTFYSFRLLHKPQQNCLKSQYFMR